MSTFEENLPIVGVNDLANTVAEGYLEKKRKEKKFRSEKLQKRWCVIQDNNFYYFVKPNDLKQKGSFSLKGYSFHRLGDLSFSVVCEGRRHYEFVAPSKEEAEKWRKAIVKASASKKVLRKSDSCPGIDPTPPVSPTRDRSVSIPSDSKSVGIPPKIKARSHTPDPFGKSPNLNSRDRSNTLGREGRSETRPNPRSALLKKTQSSPYTDKSFKPTLVSTKKQSVDEYGYAKVKASKGSHSSLDRLEKNETIRTQHWCSSSEDSDSDYDTVDPVRPIPIPRSKPVQNILSRPGLENQRNLSLNRRQMPVPPPKSNSPVSSDDEEEYDIPDESLLRPESDYDIAGNYLRKKKENLVKTDSAKEDYINASKLKLKSNQLTTSSCKLDIKQDMDKSRYGIPTDETVRTDQEEEEEEEEYYMDTSKIATLPNTKRRQKTTTDLAAVTSKLNSIPVQDDVYIEHSSGPLLMNSDDSESLYFIPMDETVHLQNAEPTHCQPEFEEENPYFEPVSDVVESSQTPELQMAIARSTSVEGSTAISHASNKLPRTPSRNSDGYSKPEDVALLKRKPSASDTKKSNLFTDDSVIYVNLPCVMSETSQSKQTARQDHVHSSTKKLHNAKLKDSVDDSSYSDSDDYDYSEY
ncbi:uncharacterized protein LOC117314808 [Pecten maximus]|uniref:uncharacterized protein LOC117314808 n=1 Tax=Pecten maximus TaxID=6579 RepID=UPI00145868BC|nr:uncharacterized protein LOC117314808 [Pecten maximus]